MFETAIKTRIGNNDSGTRVLSKARIQTEALRVVQPVVLTRAGTEMNRFGLEHQAWRDSLDPISQHKVVEVRLDTADLVSLFRLPRATTLQIAVPRDLDLVFQEPDRYPELAAALMPGYRPLTRDDGGTLPRNDACIALFDQEPEVSELLRRGLATALQIPESGYSHGGRGRGVSSYVLGFAGGTTCAGVAPFLPPLLQMEAYGARADLWLSLHLTLPDHAPGFDENTHRRREANAMSTMLELLALKETRPLQMAVGERNVSPPTGAALFDELVLYGWDSDAGVLYKPDDQTRIAQRVVRLLAENGNGVGATIRLERIRRRHVLNNPAPGTTHQGAMAAYGYAEIRFDRELLAKAFANRTALEYLRYAVHARSDVEPGPGLLEQLAGGNLSSWVAGLQQRMMEVAKPVVLDVSDLGPADLGQVERRRQSGTETWSHRREQMQAEVPALLQELTSEISWLVIQALAQGLVTGLATQLNYAAQALQSLAQSWLDQVEARYDTAQGTAEAAAKKLMDTRRRRDDETVLSLLAAWGQAETALWQADWHREVARLWTGIFSNLARNLTTWARQIDQRTIQLRQAVQPEGDLGRGVKYDPVWLGELSTLPCERLLFTPWEADVLYEKLQPLRRRDLTGQWQPVPETLEAVGQAIGRGLRERFLGEADPQELWAAVQTYFWQQYSDALATLSLSQALREVHGNLEPLREKLAWAFEVAHGYLRWLDLHRDVRHLHHYLVIELGSDDTEVKQMIEETADVEPHLVPGDRSPADSILVLRATWGLHLGLLPAFRPGGRYWTSYVTLQRAWQEQREPPVHASPWLEKLVMQRFPEVAAAVSWPG